MWGRASHFCSQSLVLSQVRQEHVFSEISKSLSNPYPTGPQAKPEKQVPPIIKGRGGGRMRLREGKSLTQGHTAKSVEELGSKAKYSDPRLGLPSTHAVGLKFQR